MKIRSTFHVLVFLMAVLIFSMPFVTLAHRNTSVFFASRYGVGWVERIVAELSQAQESVDGFFRVFCRHRNTK